MKRRKKKGLNPVFAVVLLVVGAGFAGKSFLDLSKGPQADADGDVEIVDMPEMEPQSGSEEWTRDMRWVDLLAKHGSFDGKTEVRVAFSVLDEAPTPVPTGETIGDTTFWDGPDPPELRLGVVMISDKSKRAVLGGQVVGVSDDVAGVVVQSIGRDRIVTLWNSKVLTYDLDNGWPREFRAEIERRQRESGMSDNPRKGGESAGSIDPGAVVQENQQ